MSHCPNFPRCRFCPYLTWSAEESDFICINPDYTDWVEAIKRRNSDEEDGAGADHS